MGTWEIATCRGVQVEVLGKEHSFSELFGIFHHHAEGGALPVRSKKGSKVISGAEMKNRASCTKGFPYWSEPVVH